MSPKIIDHDQRRRDIIDVTWRLIVEGGIESATMRQIATAAGFANGALKHYFPSKDAIIQSAYERALETMNSQVVEAVGDARGLQALKAISWFTAPIDEGAVTAGRVLLAFWERAVSNDDLHAAYMRHLNSWRGSLARYIAEAREDGEITSPVPDEQLVDELVLMNAGSTIMRVIAPDHSTVELQKRHLDHFFRQVTRG